MQSFLELKFQCNWLSATPLWTGLILVVYDRKQRHQKYFLRWIAGQWTRQEKRVSLSQLSLISVAEIQMTQRLHIQFPELLLNKAATTYAIANPSVYVAYSLFSVQHFQVYSNFFFFLNMGLKAGNCIRFKCLMMLRCNAALNLFIRITDSDTHVYRRSPHWNNLNICNDRRPIT